MFKKIIQGYINLFTKDKPVELNDDIKAIAERILMIIKNKTVNRCIEIKTYVDLCTVYDSKFGGIPYLPANFDYPCEEYDDDIKNAKPLRLLAQINFEQMPPLKNYPDKGILQFFISNNDTCGCDDDYLVSQDGFRIIYHENIELDVNNLSLLPKMNDTEEEDYFPIEKELKLNFAYSSQSMNYLDFNFQDILQETFEQLHDEGKINKKDTKKITEYISQKCNESGHIIGGHPYFLWEDPRAYDEDYADHTVLLLQIAYEKNDEYEIRWGEDGACCFLITQEDLANRDFSNVIYYWEGN